MGRLPSDPTFAQFVSLACHDLRTPLATVTGFVRTLPRLLETDERAQRYLALIDAGATQLGELLEDLSLAARIENGSYDPHRTHADTLELARAAAARVVDGSVAVAGTGADVDVERDVAVRSLAHLARCALRHGGVANVELAVAGSTVTIAPVGTDVAPILLGQELRDLGAAVAMRAVAALGGSVEVEDGRALVRFAVGGAG